VPGPGFGQYESAFAASHVFTLLQRKTANGAQTADTLFLTQCEWGLSRVFDDRETMPRRNF
jgi:hypothetical protein